MTEALATYLRIVRAVEAAVLAGRAQHGDLEVLRDAFEALSFVATLPGDAPTQPPPPVTVVDEDQFCPPA